MSRTYTQRPNKDRSFYCTPWIYNECDEFRRGLSRLKLISGNGREVHSFTAAMDLKEYLGKREWWHCIGRMMADKAPREHQFGCVDKTTRNTAMKRERFRTKRALMNASHDFEEYFEGDCMREYKTTRYFF